jgi:hypothetical protein
MSRQAAPNKPEGGALEENEKMVGGTPARWDKASRRVASQRDAAHPRYRVFNNHIFYRNLKSTLHSSLAFKVADFLFAAQFTRPRNAPSSALTG